MTFYEQLIKQHNNQASKFYPEKLLAEKPQYNVLYKDWKSLSTALNNNRITLETPLKTSKGFDIALGQLIYAYSQFLMHNSNTNSRQIILPNGDDDYKKLCDKYAQKDYYIAAASIDENSDNVSQAERIAEAFSPFNDIPLPSVGAQKAYTVTLSTEFGGYIHSKNFCEYKCGDEPEKYFSVFDLFFSDGSSSFQPVTDVIYSTAKELNTSIQTIAATQIMDWNCSMVIDEVGMGKTVSGIYSIADVINQCEADKQSPKNLREANEPVSILVVCPYGKRADWCADIMRQLGLFAYNIGMDQIGKVHNFTSYPEDVPYICVLGQNKNQLIIEQHENSTTSESDIDLAKKEDEEYAEKSFNTYKYAPNHKPWDLIIIDECHIATSNYEKLRAKRLLLLTATPVISKENDNKPGFEKYNELFKTIVEPQLSGIQIDPFKQPSQTNPYVLNFKENMFGGVEILRQINWVSWKRENQENDKKYITAINSAYAWGGAFNATFMENDMLMPDPPTTDKKFEALKKVLEGDQNHPGCGSVLIFTEYVETAKYLYRRIKDLFDTNKGSTLVALKTGKGFFLSGSKKNSDLIMDLKDNIANGGRSILIATGKSLGTGFSLGEFDAEINYELPFTSNELEQRFGRIERVNTMINSMSNNKKLEKQFYLFYNTPADPNGSITASDLNIRLNHCITHMDETLKYIPARNTVFLHGKHLEEVKATVERLCHDLPVYFAKKYGKFSINFDKMIKLLVQMKSFDIHFTAADDFKHDIRIAIGNPQKPDEIKKAILNTLNFNNALKILDENDDTFSEFEEDYSKLIFLANSLNNMGNVAYLILDDPSPEVKDAISRIIVLDKNKQPDNIELLIDPDIIKVLNALNGKFCSEKDINKIISASTVFMIKGGKAFYCDVRQKLWIE